MAESTLSVTYSDLLRYVSRFVGWTREPEYSTGTVTIAAGVATLAGGTWPSWAANGTLQLNSNFYTVNTRDSNTQITLDNTGVTAVAGTNYTLFDVAQDEAVDLQDIIKSAQRRFYTPDPLDGYTHRWSFMDPPALLTTVAPYSTGTVAATAGVVTLTGGTWPARADEGDLRVAGVSYTVATRTSGSVITLNNTSVSITSGTAYDLVFQGFELPDDFGGISGDVVFRPEQRNDRYVLRRVSEEHIRTLAATYPTPARPTLFCLSPGYLPSDGSEGPRWSIRFDCPVDEAYVFQYRYTVNPEAMTSADPFPWGGMAHAETFVALALAAADFFINDKIGEAEVNAQKRLKASIESDRLQMAPHRLGQGTRNSIVRCRDYPPTRGEQLMVDYTSNLNF